jgi:phage baseplate assembly protein W
MLKNINLIVGTGTLTSDKVYLNTPEQSLNDMIETPKGSRVMLPTYGSAFYKLIDMIINDLWIIKAKKAILECTRCEETLELWDDRVEIKSLSISIVNNEAEIEVQLV